MENERNIDKVVISWATPDSTIEQLSLDTSNEVNLVPFNFCIPSPAFVRDTPRSRLTIFMPQEWLGFVILMGMGLPLPHHLWSELLQTWIIYHAPYRHIHPGIREPSMNRDRGRRMILKNDLHLPSCHLPDVLLSLYEVLRSLLLCTN